MTFDRLVLATGACARKLPLPGATGDLALTLRNRTDADKLREKLLAARDVIIVGAGFIGLEVAATARKLGKPVTMVEAGDRILARLFPGQMSDFLARRHRAAGSELIFSAIVTDLRTAGDSRRRVTLDSGRVMDVDLVVAGIGARVNDHLARNAGLACEDGILVNEAGRTSHPHIYAAGDCAAWTLPHESRPSRTESVQNAVDQAKTVAASLCGLPLPAKSAPWFWSDQMDIKLQMVGNAIEADRIICRGDQESGRFSLFYYQQSRLVRVDSVNRPMDHMAARKLVTRRSELPPHVAADPAIKLTEYI
jgi:3-phenylpropionate/trans-cinnamate dioxygenase ferredoxin reductase subunit